MPDLFNHDPAGRSGNGTRSQRLPLGHGKPYLTGSLNGCACVLDGMTSAATSRTRSCWCFGVELRDGMDMNDLLKAYLCIEEEPDQATDSAPSELQVDVQEHPAVTPGAEDGETDQAAVDASGCNVDVIQVMNHTAPTDRGIFTTIAW